MITPLNILLIIIWSIVVPVILGQLLCVLSGGRESGSISVRIAYGFLVMCVIFMLLAIPMIAMKLPFHVLWIVWVAVVSVLCVLILALSLRRGYVKNIVANARSGMASFAETLRSDRLCLFAWCMAIAVIFFQMCLSAFTMHVDTDDSRFIAEAMEALEKDTMLQHHAITGKFLGFAPGEQIKDVTAPYPLFIALLSRLYGLHPAITAHTVLPFLLIPLSYVVFAMAGSFLLGSDKKKMGLFLLFLSLITLFSFETIYASGYTLLTIIWQGRSICAMIMLPLLWLFLMRASIKEKLGAADYCLIIIASLGNAMMSNMGAVLAPVLTAIYALTLGIRRRSFKILVLLGLCAVPDLICVVSTRIMRLFL